MVQSEKLTPPVRQLGAPDCDAKNRPSAYRRDRDQSAPLETHHRRAFKGNGITPYTDTRAPRTQKWAGETRPWSNLSPPAIAAGSTGCVQPAAVLGSIMSRKVMLAAPRQTRSACNRRLVKVDSIRQRATTYRGLMQPFKSAFSTSGDIARFCVNRSRYSIGLWRPVIAAGV